jgi:hypothetical protein
MRAFLLPPLVLDFWQRYLYRTQNVDRVMHELLQADEKRKQARSGGIMSFMGSSTKPKQQDDGQDVIFASQQGDDENENHTQEIQWVEFPSFPIDNSNVNNHHQQQQQQQSEEEEVTLEVAQQLFPAEQEQQGPLIDVPTTTIATEALPMVTPRTEKKLILVNDLAFTAPVTTIASNAAETPQEEEEEEEEEDDDQHQSGNGHSGDDTDDHKNMEETISAKEPPKDATPNVQTQPTSPNPDPPSAEPTPAINNNTKNSTPAPIAPDLLTPRTEKKINMVHALSFTPGLPVDAVRSKNAPGTKKCLACNMDSEFVPDGMIPCDKCELAHYCSADCRQWHWKQPGGHAKDCVGGKGDGLTPAMEETSSRDACKKASSKATTFKDPVQDMVDNDSDNESIDPLEAFKTWPRRGNIVEALRRAREEHAEKMCQSSPALFVEKDSDFVAKMSKSTPVLFVDFEDSDDEEEAPEDEHSGGGEEIVHEAKELPAQRRQSVHHPVFQISLWAILVTVTASVLLAKSKWTVPLFDAICAPIFPYQELSDRQHQQGVVGIAPWWFPGEENANLKREAFQWVCGGDRKQTMLTWAKAKNPKDGFGLTITNAASPQADDKTKKAKSNDKPLLTRKRVHTVNVLPSSLEVVCFKSTGGETVQAPWTQNTG